MLTNVATASAKEALVFFGTFTNGLSRGIYASRLDERTGKLSAPELAAQARNPNFLALSPGGKTLYAATRGEKVPNEPPGAVNAFAIDAATGKLTLLNQKSSGGAGPCFLSADAAGQFLFVANYVGGSMKSFLLQPDGSIGDEGTFIQHHGHSVNPDRQAEPHTHWVAGDPSGHFALACDLGMDKILVYRINPADATLTANDPPFATVPPGSGARHLAFSRDGKFAHVINEMTCTITTFAWESKKGTLTAPETISALPPDLAVQKTFSGGEIVVRPDGKFIYATVRGHDSISVFAADAKSGRLTFVENVPSRGQIPRGLGVDPSGRWLIVCNQKTDSAVVFGINARTGKLTPTGQDLQIGGVSDVRFLGTK